MKRGGRTSVLLGEGRLTNTSMELARGWLDGGKARGLMRVRRVRRAGKRRTTRARREALVLTEESILMCETTERSDPSPGPGVNDHGRGAFQEPAGQDVP